MSDLELLRACVDYCSGGAFPTDAFIGVPPKVVIAKQRKAIQKGLVKENWTLTSKGALFLREADDEGEIE